MLSNFGLGRTAFAGRTSLPFESVVRYGVFTSATPGNRIPREPAYPTVATKEEPSCFSRLRLYCITYGVENSNGIQLGAGCVPLQATFVVVAGSSLLQTSQMFGKTTPEPEP